MLRPARPALALLIATAAGHVAAQETRLDPAPAEELLEVERELGDAADRKEDAENRAAAAQRAVARLSQELVAAGDRAQRLELALMEAESHLEGLEAAKAVTEALLAERREQLVEALAALQRLDLEPPPALLVKPEDALSAARGAMLLGTLVPELKGVADDLAAKLHTLDDLSRSIAREKEQIRRDQLSLDAERRRIDELLVAKRAEQEMTAEEAAEARERLAALAGKARSLRDLLGGLEGDVPTFAALRPSLPGEEAPPASFADLRGQLRTPVIGRISQRFGADDGSGGHAQGLTVTGGPKAEVISPADAEIVFAGPFRSYGNVLIITPGDDYLIVLAGLAEIYGAPGQRLLAGEPVGRLSDGTGQAATGADGAPVLYIEFRKAGNPVDPAAWLRFNGRPA